MYSVSHFFRRTNYSKQHYFIEELSRAVCHSSWAKAIYIHLQSVLLLKTWWWELLYGCGHPKRNRPYSSTIPKNWKSTWSIQGRHQYCAIKIMKKFSCQKLFTGTLEINNVYSCFHFTHLYWVLTLCQTLCRILKDSSLPSRGSSITSKADQKADNHEIVRFAVRKVCIIYSEHREVFFFSF